MRWDGGGSALGVPGRCNRPGKHPWWREKDGDPQGFKHGALAAVNYADAMKWKCAGNRLAAVPGDRVLVLDLDGDRAFRTFLRIARLVEVEQFIGAARTPRGYHVWLRMVTDGWSQAAALTWMRSWLGKDMKGLDLRCGDRSYVVWPGGEQGRRRWLGVAEWKQIVERAYVPGWDIGPGSLNVANSWGPVWLAGEQDARPVQAKAAATGEIELPPMGSGGPEWAWEQLGLAMDRLGKMPPGSGRNNRLNVCAYFQGATAVWMGCPRDKVVARLLEGGTAAGTHGVAATVASGLSAGLDKLSGKKS